MIVGDAIGSLIDTSVFNFPAPSSAAASTRLRSTRSSPTMVLRRAAGHAVQKIIATLERRPMPRARMNSGKRARADTGRMKSTIGIIIARALRLSDAMIPDPVPNATATRKPSATIWMLDATCGRISPLTSTRHMAETMTSGVGRKGLRRTEAANCHKRATTTNGNNPLLTAIHLPTRNTSSSPHPSINHLSECGNSVPAFAAIFRSSDK
jgi:hypothetical protein